MNENYKVSRGEVIVLSSGEYSDYGIVGYLIALKDFDIEALVKTLNINGDSIDTYSIGGWLVANEYALPVTHREIWLDGLFQ